MLTNAYISLSAANGAHSKDVFITPDMIVGGTFNPSYFEFENSTDVVPSNFTENNSANGAYYTRSQEVQFAYASVIKKVNVTIQYSDISRIGRYADILSRPVADGGVDYANMANIVNGVTGYEFTPEQLQMATEAAELFLDITEADERALVTADVRERFLSVATYSFYVDWFEGFIGDEENVGFGDYIELMLNASSGAVEVSFVGDTYEKAKATYAALTTGETGTAFAELSRKNDYLWRILGDQELAYGTFYTKENGDVVTLAAGCAYAVPQSEIIFQVAALEYLIELYEMFHNDENNITYSALLAGTLTDAQKSVIASAYTKIASAQSFLGYRSIYSIISTWGDGDFYEILYQYYYDLAVEEMRRNPSHDNWETNTYLESLAMLGYYAYMPADVEAFYTYAYYVYQTFDTFSQDTATYGGIMDATELFVYYNGVLEVLDYFDTIKADGSVEGAEDNSDFRKASRLLSKNLMEVMEFVYPYVTEVVEIEGQQYEVLMPIAADDILDGFRYNYLYLTENMYEVAQFESLIADYMVLVSGYFNGEYFDVVDNGDGTSMQDWNQKFFAAVPEFMQKLIKYSPDIQTAFVVTISDNPALLLDVSAEYGSTYLSALLMSYHDRMVSNGYTTVVTYEGKQYDVFAQMLLAYENYVRDGYYYTETDMYSVSSFLGYFRDGYNVYDSEGIEIISTVPAVIDLWEELDLTKLDNNQAAMVEALYNYLDKVTYMYSVDGATYVGASINDYNNWGTAQGETKAYWEARFKSFADELGKYYISYFAAENLYAIAPYLSYALHIEDEYAKLVAEIDALDNEALKADLHDIMSYVNFGIFDGRYARDKGKLGTGNFTIEFFYNYFRSYYTTLIANMTVFGSEVFGQSAQGYEYLFYHWDEDLAAFFESGAETLHTWAEVTFTTNAGGLSVASSASVRNVENADEFFKTYLSMTELTSTQKAIFREINYYPTLTGSVDHFELPFSYYYLNKLGYDTTQSGNWNQQGQEYAMYYAIRYFINVVNTYVDYDLYTERYAEFAALDPNYQAFYSGVRSDYETCVQQFNYYFGRLTETQKAAFRAEFGEDLINAYLTSPGR